MCLALAAFSLPAPAAEPAPSGPSPVLGRGAGGTAPQPLDPTALAVAEAVDALASNRTKIELVANNITLFDAILRVKNLSRANIVFSYMEPADRISETVVTNSALNVAELQVKASAGAAAKSRRVTYATSGPMEWRAVLAAVLAPDYTFDEKDGMVRIATKAKFEALRKAENDEKPMGLRYIRVYNASPEEVVERLTSLNVLMSSKGSLLIAPYKEKTTGSVNSYRHNLSSYTTSGTATKGGTSVSVKSDSGSGSWGNLLRPRNPPAILAYDAVDNLDKIEEYVRMMDVREKQVLIEALILELSDTGARNLGMNLDRMGLKSINLLNSTWSRSLTREGTSGSESAWNRDMKAVNSAFADTETTRTMLSGYDHTAPTVKDTVGTWTRTTKSSDDSSEKHSNETTTVPPAQGTTTTIVRTGETDANNYTQTTTTTPASTSTTGATDSMSAASSLAEAFTQTITGGFTIPGSLGYGDTLKNSSTYKQTSDIDDVDTRSNRRFNTRKTGRGSSFSATFGPINFNLVLELVEEEGNGKLLSSPVLTVGDHSEAMIHVGTITPIANVESKYVGDLSSSVAQSVSWLELVSGVMMWVGPEITDGGDLVRLWIHPKISEKTGKVVSFNNIEYPELQSEEIDTRVAVPSGNTLMIGGLTRNIKQERVQRVPILGYIPFIGRLFRHVSTENSRQNLVILIRPTILDDDEPDTGFEHPALKVVDTLNAESGRNLKDVKVGENDPLFRNERAVKSFLGIGAAAPSEAEAKEGADGQDGDAEDEAEGAPEPAAAAPGGDAESASADPVKTPDA